MSTTFVPMTQVIPEGQKGRARVEHFKVSREESMFSGLRPGDYVPEGEYAKLLINGTLYMSDTHMEKRTNTAFVRRAAGKVLLAGLGLGMVLVPILQNPAVTEVTVLELHQDVVDLILPALQAYEPLKPFMHKLTIVVGDIYDFVPAKGQTWDVIYFDIWAEQSTDTLKDMEKLHRRFASRLTKGSPYRWMNSWRKDILKSDKAREKRQSFFSFRF